jgi:hypothetical protein
MKFFPASGNFVIGEASSINATKSSRSKLCTSDLPHLHSSPGEDKAMALFHKTLQRS